MNDYKIFTYKAEISKGMPVEIAECPGKIADRTRLVLGE